MSDAMQEGHGPNYPFPVPGLDDCVNGNNATEAAAWCLKMAEECKRELRMALQSARAYVTVHEEHTRAALAVAMERRAAMIAWVHFTRAYHCVAVAWECMGREASLLLVAQLHALELESDDASEMASRIGERLGASARFEACR